MDEFEEATLHRLLAVAHSDTGQSRKVSNFLLAWWNAQSCGKWDPTELWGLDLDLQQDILAVLAAVARLRSYPDWLGYGAEFTRLLRRWRPHLLRDEQPG